MESKDELKQNIRNIIEELKNYIKNNKIIITIDGKQKETNKILLDAADKIYLNIVDLIDSRKIKKEDLGKLDKDDKKTFIEYYKVKLKKEESYIKRKLKESKDDYETTLKSLNIVP